LPRGRGGSLHVAGVGGGDLDGLRGAPDWGELHGVGPRREPQMVAPLGARVGLGAGQGRSRHGGVSTVWGGEGRGPVPLDIGEGLLADSIALVSGGGATIDVPGGADRQLEEFIDPGPGLLHHLGAHLAPGLEGVASKFHEEGQRAMSGVGVVNVATHAAALSLGIAHLGRNLDHGGGG
jgi:hypothetical protein